MKKIIFLIACIALSSNVFSNEISNSCFKNASKAVASHTQNKYDPNGMETLSCKLTPNKVAVICDVNAYKGNGAANDSFLVVLNSDCSKVFRVELTGEE